MSDQLVLFSPRRRPPGDERETVWQAAVALRKAGFKVHRLKADRHKVDDAMLTSRELIRAANRLQPAVPA